MPTRSNTAPDTTAIALTIAGSDSSGGAGIQADLKAFSALGAYGASVITAITAQNTRSVTAVHEIPADMVFAQIRAVLDDLEVDAIKIGMLSSPKIIQTVCNALADFKRAIVVDPVMVAKSGDILLQQTAVESLKSDLLPLASLITPNLPEAAQLLGCGMATDQASMLAQGQALLELGAGAVLMKGGHGSGSECIDLLVTRSDSIESYRAARIDTRNTHGTGCTLAASIAAFLANNLPLHESVKRAHSYLQASIKAADKLQIGQGHGPVHHFHRQW